MEAQPSGCGLGSLHRVRSTLPCGQQVQLSQTGLGQHPVAGFQAPLPPPAEAPVGGTAIQRVGVVSVSAAVPLAMEAGGQTLQAR